MLLATITMYFIDTRCAKEKIVVKCNRAFTTYSNRPTCSPLSECFVPRNLGHLLKGPGYRKTLLASSHQHHMIWCKHSRRTIRPSFRHLKIQLIESRLIITKMLGVGSNYIVQRGQAHYFLARGNFSPFP